MFTFSQLTIPLIQAPMAGGVNTAEMVSSVANQGAVGSFGFAYTDPKKIASDLQQAQSKFNTKGNGALNVNFFVFSDVKTPSYEDVELAVTDLANTSTHDEVSFQIPKPPFFPDIQDQLEPVWELRPEILTFHLGTPNPKFIEKAHALGIAVGMSATCESEARSIEKSGADFIVAQGIEAGGHRGIFNIDQHDECLSTLALTKVLSKAVKLPVVAAGGIMVATDVGNALTAGATAVQMGSAFLTTHESGASIAHKRYLIHESNRPTVLTTGFSGRPARAISNYFTDKMNGKNVLTFPLQNSLTGNMRAVAVKRDDGEHQSLWAGNNFSACREESVEDLITRVFEKT